ncbi:MAG: patatin-like phospholipase family protein [Clostridia bacterium]|nr:patatin-like phospholipase family protein [Clostridia bacterium]
MSIGLALSGGGAKGAAHIGVLQALKEENINIEYISGTSSGSIVAALYAAGYNPFNIYDMFTSYCSHIFDCDKRLPFKVFGTVFTGKISIKGLAKGDNLERLMRRYLSDKSIYNISQVKIPLAIPTVDLKSGEIVYFLSKNIENRSQGYDDEPSYIYSANLASVVRASSSFPAVFEPKILQDKILVDGGVRVNTPVSILKQMGAKKVLAICFDKNDKCDTYSKNIIGITMKTFDIMGHQVNEEELSRADFVLTPNVEDVGLLDCSKTKKIVNQGYYAVKNNIDKIKERICD